MAPILQDTSKKIQRVPAYVLKQVETRAKQLYTAPMKALDSIPKGITELNRLGKRLESSDQFLKAWKMEGLKALSPGDVHVGFPEGPQAPVTRLETLKDSTPNHFQHSERKGSSCKDSFNCHAYAIGKPLENANETYFVKKFEVSPEATSHPNWNHDPANELKKNYVQVPPGSPTQVGDVILYGQDFNNNQRIDTLYESPGGKLVPEIAHSAVVVEVKDGKPVLCESKRGSEPAIVRHGPDADVGLKQRYGYRLGTFRLKPQANPERGYQP